MIEIRNLTEHWEGLDRSGEFYVKNKDGPRLQYRIKEQKQLGRNIFFEWSEWIDVEDVHVDI